MKYDQQNAADEAKYLLGSSITSRDSGLNGRGGISFSLPPHKITSWSGFLLRLTD